MDEHPTLIGLCGDIGSGKSSVAKWLVNSYGFRSSRFAGKLKDVALDVYGPVGLERRHVDGTQAEKNEPLPRIVDADGDMQTGRKILEHLGTEGFRAIDPDTWVKYALLAVDECGESVVFEDCRFPNEFEAVREAGGVVWEVVKAGSEPAQRTGHESDELWRTLPKDGRAVALAGDMSALHLAVDLLMGKGGKD